MSDSVRPSIFATPGARVEIPIEVTLATGTTIRATFASAVSPNQTFELVAYPFHETDADGDIRLVGQVPDDCAPGEYTVARMHIESEDESKTMPPTDIGSDEQPDVGVIEVLGFGPA